MAGDITGCPVWVTCGVVLVACSKTKTYCMLLGVYASLIFLFIALSRAPLIFDFDLGSLQS